MRGLCVVSLAALAACGQGSVVGPLQANRPSGTALGPSGKIHHVVIIFQENRSVDDLFNGFPGADTVRSGTNSEGQQVPLKPVSLTAPYDLGHSNSSFKVEYADGKMNGFSNVHSICKSVIVCTPRDIRAYGFVPRGEAKPLFDMAEQYVFGDRMFQTNQGPSFPAHQYILSGTSTISNGSSLRAAENPLNPLGLGPDGGCDSPPGALVTLIDSAGNEGQPVYPCFDRVSITDLLEKKSLSWRYYQAYIGPGLWNAPDAILRIRKSRAFRTNVVAPPSTILTDVANGKLADVVWVTPTAVASDHAYGTNGSGPSWVAAVVNAIGQSRFWNDTAIFVTWDDWGGWFDHVAPPLYNSYELGFRVPLVVVSPYAKTHYVSHVQHEFGSILKFTEETFGLGSMHTTDARADDLADCFNFSRAPRKFKKISAPFSRQYFLKQPASMQNPDNDF
jgi:phospholipase C